MAKKKDHITRERLIDCYMDYVVDHQGTGLSIEELSSSYDFTEDDFLVHFENFETLNKAIYKIFIDNAVSVLNEDEDFEKFSKKDKLLSLYYTLFENFTLNRDFVLLTVKSYGLNLNALPLFSGLRESFLTFVDLLKMETLGLSSTLESIQKKSLQEGLWVQFLLTVKFWMSDDSQNCEKTDIFIEKSVNTGVELLNTKSLNNIIDLGKFLYSEKIRSKGL